MASPAGIGNEEAAPLLATSSASTTGVIRSQYQSLGHSDITSEDANDDASTADATPWALNQSARRLYISHTLSTWNSRVFEFGSVLYLASIFPGTLLPLAVYSMVRGAAAITLSSWVGHYIDRNDRLKTVRLSISRKLQLFPTQSC